MGGTRVYVGGLPYGVREKDLERFFKGYGRIRDILIKNGYGFVEFDDYRDADDAVYELNGKDLIGERVLVERARGVPRDGRDDRDGGRDGGRGGGGNFRGRFNDRGGGRGGDRRGQPRGSSDKYGPPTRTEYRLVVENLSSRVSWQDLKDYMRQAGEVTYADAHKQRRNEGVVEFASHSDMKAAMDKLDGSELNGRKIKLVEERSRGRGGGSGGRRGSKSSSRSRSKSRSRSRRRDSRSRSKSKSKSRSKSGSKSKSRSRSKSRESRGKSRSKSRSPVGKAKRQSKSKSRSRSRSRSLSKSRDEKSRSRSGSNPRRDSRSRSKSPGDKNGDRSPEKDD